MNLFYKSADIVKSSLQIYLDEGQQFSQACDYVTGFHNAAEHCIFLRQFTLWNILCVMIHLHDIYNFTFDTGWEIKRFPSPMFFTVDDCLSHTIWNKGSHDESRCGLVGVA